MPGSAAATWRAWIWRSRADKAERRYVQHLLAAHAEEVQACVARGATLYVCGALHGMAAGVDEALRGILGEDGLDQLLAAGRYRRDVY